MRRDDAYWQRYQKDDSETYMLFLWFLVGAMLGSVAYGVAYPSEAPPPSAEYWKARVSTSIAIQPITPIPLQIPTAERGSYSQPVVTCYTATWCQTCKMVKEDDLKCAFPFKVRYWDIDAKAPPIDVPTLPAFHWNGFDGKGRQWPPPDYATDKRGYPGAEELVRIWRQSQREPSTDKSNGSESKPPPAPANQLTPEQRAMYERAKAAGYSDQQILNYARRHGYVN